MAKRGYNRDTIRGGASDWDVSRPFSSYLRLLGGLLAHPIRFFELLPKIPDPRAPALFLIFSGLLAAIAWVIAIGAGCFTVGLLIGRSASESDSYGIYVLLSAVVATAAIVTAIFLSITSVTRAKRGTDS